MGDEETLGFGDSGKLKGEIDTSAPFESVKEAVTKFGGLGFWKPVSNLHKSTHSFLVVLLLQKKITRIPHRRSYGFKIRINMFCCSLLRFFFFF